ncbi:MAG: hypothetical protein MHM6MM_007311 [Cercozoa sp. M6MM]
MFLPVLTLEDGTKIAQSLMIELYLAAKSPVKLLGDSLEKQAEVTSLLLQVYDLHYSFARFWFALPEAERTVEKAQKEATEGDISKVLDGFSRYLTNVRTDFLFGDSISLADLAIFNVRNLMDKFPDEVFPVRFIAIANKVAQIPEIADYVAQRPITPF